VAARGVVLVAGLLVLGASLADPGKPASAQARRAEKLVPVALLWATRDSVQRSAEADVALPVDQWLATGRVTSVSHATLVRVGEVRIRAWFFKSLCAAGEAVEVSCGVNFIREVTSAGEYAGPIIYGSNEATIAWQAAPSLSVSFSPDENPCSPQADARQGQEYDTYDFSQSPRTTGPHDEATLHVI
jgi:hypothetical protein